MCNIQRDFGSLDGQLLSEVSSLSQHRIGPDVLFCIAKLCLWKFWKLNFQNENLVAFNEIRISGAPAARPVNFPIFFFVLSNIQRND